MKIQLDPGAKMPTRGHATDAGLDLYSMSDGYVYAGGMKCLMPVFMYRYRPDM